MREIIHLAAELRVPVVSTAPGGAPGSDADRDAARLHEALAILADEADRVGVIIAVETCGLSAADVRKLIADVGSPFIGVCCDAGAMLMQGDNPHAVGELFADNIRLVRARDAVHPTAEAPGGEVAMGDGHLDPARFLAALNGAGFSGDIVLSRTAGTKRMEELRRAREMFLACPR